jgi:hypothetical protein
MQTQNLALTLRRGTVAVLLAFFTVGLIAGPASAQSINDVRDKKRSIAVGDVVVEQGQKVNGPVVSIDGTATVGGKSDNGVLVIHGDAKIEDTALIQGDVLVIDGAARISGHVTDDVIVLHGRAVIQDGATVGGDVKSTKHPRVERGARVHGSVDTIDTTGTFTAFGIRILGFLWLAVTVSTGVLGLLFVLLLPRAAQTSSRAARRNTGKSIGIGVLMAIGLPVLAVLAAITIVGLPFALGLFGALGLIHALGYVVAAYSLGRIMVKEPKSSIGAFFAGWAILRALALLPGIGVLVFIAAAIWGLGALTVSAWRGGRAPLEPPPEPKVKPAPAAVPAAAATGETATTDEAAPGDTAASTGQESATTWSADDAATGSDAAPADAGDASATTAPTDTTAPDEGTDAGKDASS